MKRGKRCFHQSCLAAAPFASPSNPEVHACEIHKKRDFVNMRNKRCLAPGCYRNPHYGVSRLIDPNSKAQYCTKHKSPGMQNVNGGRCAGPDCSKQPRFSMPGEKGKYCSKHREEGMVDVLYTPCAADGCKKHPHFGHVEGGPRYCAQHRSEGMVDVKHRRCAVKSCRKDRVLIPGTAMKRGKFCEVHCDVNELINKEAGSSNGASNDKKSSRTWTPGTEDDGEYMSSEGSQLGSSIGEQKSNMSCDGSSANSSIRPSIHDAAQGLAYLAMLASRECAPLYSGSTYDHGSTPFQPPEHAENFRRGPARAAAGRGPSSAGFNEGRTAPHAAMINEYHAEPASARPSFYPVGKRRSETDPQYPMFKRERIHSDDSFGARRLRVSPELRGSGSGNGNSDRTVSPASTPAPPFDLRYSSEYSAYPCPWEFAREGQGARWAEGNVRAPTPVRGWNSHHSAV